MKIASPSPKKDFHIWEGVYRSFDDVPVKGDGFLGNRFIENALKRITQIRNRARSETLTTDVTQYGESLLPVVAAFFYSKKGRVRVLDFGGALGFTYYQILRGLSESENLEFHIVDNHEVCKAGRRFFIDEPHVYFHETLPENKHVMFDIVHLGSSLQYIEKWQSLLSCLSQYKAKYILFTDLLAGDIPTFVTAQNYYESKIPLRFFNLNEIKDHMRSLQYKMIFKSAYRSTLLGHLRDELPLDHFDQKYRIKNSCNLVFVRKT